MVWGWMDNWYILGAVIVVAAALLLDWFDGRRRARHAKQNHYREKAQRRMQAQGVQSVESPRVDKILPSDAFPFGGS